MQEFSAKGRNNFDRYSDTIKHNSKKSTSKFQVGQTVKSELGKFKGVIIKISPNASVIHTDMYTIKTNEGKREYVEEGFLELDRIDTQVAINETLDENDLGPQYEVR